MVSSIRASKALSKSTMLGGVPLSDEDQQNLSTLQNDDSVRTDQFGDVLQKIASAHARNQSLTAAATKTQNEQADAQADAQQKFQFARSLRADPNFADEESRNQVRAMVSDPKTSMSQLRIAAANIAKEKANSVKEDDRDQTAQTRQQLSDLKPQIAEKREQLTKEHPGIADLADLPDEQIVQQMASRLQDGSISADDKQALLAYRGSRADQQNLESQLAPNRHQQPTPQSSGPAQVKTPEDAAALPPGTKFITPDGQIRVRH
jgi:fructose-specific component phosphotransferase system IIB-like protein